MGMQEEAVADIYILEETGANRRKEFKWAIRNERRRE